MAAFANVVLSALVIGVAAWLSGRLARAAGFLVALPLATMLVLPIAIFCRFSSAGWSLGPEEPDLQAKGPEV